MAFLLLAPLYWWTVCVVPPLGVVEFAAHIVEAGEHCNSFCTHPSDPVPHLHLLGPPVVSGASDPPRRPLINGHIPPQAARGQPLSLLDSLSRSFRAPPSRSAVA
ncbi:MAG: hypothetical protein R3B11_04540 [Nitrospira sp.]|nr:hypothetical protein [Nitrospira sp.]MCW5787211.1 hypothetical protein [Nitrospira sp.]MDR4474095.1 hypothetical protein [Nitrospira sp.]MDR4475260.1 hypothetical protein [Nitrospira sp.]